MADKQLETVGLDRIAEISRNIREAVRAALPTPPEQFFTLMVPGKVVDLNMYKVEDDRVILPLATELNQAILCDDMPVLSTLQLGPTGRSVARSYAPTISKLKAAGTPIGIDDGNSMTPDQKRYNQAMKILSSEKQAVYTQAVANKTKAFRDALQLARDDPINKTPAQIRQAYDQWVSENARTYRNNVQATYMDWVITGKKEEVEYWFSVVDQDSALARVEKSKEVMRWAVVQDSDGSCEYQKVKLEPADWANKCLDRIKSGANQTKTAEWYTWEINRLEQTNSLLEVMKTSPPAFDATGESKDNADLNTQAKEADDQLRSAMAEQMRTEHEYQKALSSSKKAAPGSDEDTAAKEKVKETLKNYQKAQTNVRECREKYDKVNLDKLSYDNKAAHNNLIKDLQDKDPQAPSEGAKAGPDFFTPITVEVTSSSETKRTEESATSFSAGASAMSELAESSVKISFECMRVDITRPWLRPELFYDEELVPGPGVLISPGFARLGALMEGKVPAEQAEKELQDYSVFPLYPVGFLVACNVILEISGSTSSLEMYMNSSSTSASASVGYGPFSASASGAHSNSNAGSTCKSTASGCRIQIKSPQIIGWISRMVPALPRLDKKSAHQPLQNDFSQGGFFGAPAQ
ncbi:unnamed protein product [Rhizoctonia solani]|uniref:Uncharacterized protein n=1 Tax=Rhizoctonia solani TaxID=456999 RepID=A0A8H3C4G5_9AGAM|nr:unnamed protein product [Rhizoctonia solani]